MFNSKRIKELEKENSQLKEELRRQEYSNMNLQSRAKHWEGEWIKATFVCDKDKDKIMIPSRGLYIEKSGTLEGEYNVVRKNKVVLKNANGMRVLQFIFGLMKFDEKEC